MSNMTKIGKLTVFLTRRNFIYENFFLLFVGLMASGLFAGSAMGTDTSYIDICGAVRIDGVVAKDGEAEITVHRCSDNSRVVSQETELSDDGFNYHFRLRTDEPSETECSFNGLVPMEVYLRVSSEDCDEVISCGEVALAYCESARGKPTIDVDVDCCKGIIGDYVWHDQNGNGIQDAGEPGLQGVTVNLLVDGDAGLVVETEADGSYEFTGLCEGIYIVDVDENTLPSDLSVPTEPGQGRDDALDSNGPRDGKGVSVALPTDNSVEVKIDFGYQSPCTGRIGDYVWHDQNRNGIQDDGDSGLAGVTVDLFDDMGDFVAMATTDGDGFYEFTGLCAGMYTVDVDDKTLPAEFFSPTDPDQGGDDNDNVDSDGPMDRGGVSVVLPTDGSEDITADFGYVSPCTGRIGDYVWHDQNRNGIQDADDIGLAGVTVELFDNMLQVVAMAITEPDGSYEFSGLCAGDYLIEVKVPPNFNLTDPDQGENDGLDSDGDEEAVPVTLADDAAEDDTIDFGFVSPCTGSIGDFIWNDQNSNGIQDDGEPGIASVKIKLRDADGTVIATTETVDDGDGAYEFTGLCAGDYTVDVSDRTVPSSLQPTGPDKGGDDTVDSDGPVSGRAVPVRLIDDNNKNNTIDFGYAPRTTGKIGNRVYCDLNDNGDQDSGEPGIPGVRVALVCAGPDGVFGTQDDSRARQITDDVGNYLFEEVPAGRCRVRVVLSTLPADKERGKCPARFDVVLEAGQSFFNADFCFRFRTGPCDLSVEAKCEIIEDEECEECDGKVTQLILRYDGKDPVDVEVVQKKDGQVVFAGNVKPGEEFSFSGQDKKGTLGTEIGIFENEDLTARLHTSCSKPIGPGLVLGNFTVVSGESRNGGELCPIDEDDDDDSSDEDKKSSDDDSSDKDKKSSDDDSSDDNSSDDDSSSDGNRTLKVLCKYLIQNTGEVDAFDIKVEDLQGEVPGSPIERLAPGEQIVLEHRTEVDCEGDDNESDDDSSSDGGSSSSKSSSDDDSSDDNSSDDDDDCTFVNVVVVEGLSGDGECRAEDEVVITIGDGGHDNSSDDDDSDDDSSDDHTLDG